MQKQTKSLKCRLGLHKWHRTYAKLKILDTFGKVEAKVCKRCGFKSPEGRFISDKNKPMTKDDIIKK